MAKVLHIYKIQPSATQGFDGGPYNVVKLDRDLEAVDVYNVVIERHRYKDDERVFVCSCPAYKALCKHIHWVKAYRLKTKDRSDVICAYFDPSKNEMRLVTRDDSEDEDDRD